MKYYIALFVVLLSFSAVMDQLYGQKPYNKFSDVLMERSQ